MSEILLRLRAVQARTTLTRATIYRCMAAGTFPKPVKVGARAVAWPASVVDKWIAERIAASASAQ